MFVGHLVLLKPSAYGYLFSLFLSRSLSLSIHKCSTYRIWIPDRMITLMHLWYGLNACTLRHGCLRRFAAVLFCWCYFFLFFKLQINLWRGQHQQFVCDLLYDDDEAVDTFLLLLCVWYWTIFSFNRNGRPVLLVQSIIIWNAFKMFIFNKLRASHFTFHSNCPGEFPQWIHFEI